MRHLAVAILGLSLTGCGQMAYATWYRLYQWRLHREWQERYGDDHLAASPVGETPPAEPDPSPARFIE